MTPKASYLSRSLGGILFTIGYILSPVSWWDDAVVNLPLSYLIAQLVSAFNKQLFAVTFVSTYWATNLLGFLLMHFGGGYMLNRKSKPSILRMLIISFAYTVLIMALAQLQIIQAPLDYLKDR